MTDGPIQELASFKVFLSLLKVDEFGTRSVVPFVLNGPQRRLMRVIAQNEKDQRPNRIVILKSRQAGFSTLIQALILHKAITRRNYKALTVAHQVENSGTLFKIGARMYDRLPEELKEMVKQTHFRNGSMVQFNNDSDLKVDTANDENAGRGSNYNALHLSEIAFWSNTAALKTARSLRQTTQATPGSMIVMESTPAGMGGLFYKSYMDAKEGKSDYHAVFEPWFDFERNEMTPKRLALIQNRDVDTLFDGQGNLRIDSIFEEMLQEKHNLSDDQVCWLRYTLANDCNGDIDDFNQEYPSNDVDCFLASGRLFFKNPRIKAFDPLTPASKSDEGRLWTYFPPEEGRKYVAFIDPAGIQGAHHVDAGAAEDYSVIWVMRRHDYQTVAVWRGKDDPDVVAAKADEIGRNYNKAMLAPEINGSGMVILFKLNDIHHYPIIYRRIKLDSVGMPEREEEGWMTNSRNRRPILEGLGELLRDEPSKLADERLKREMFSFVINGDRPEAKTGEHDDLVMGCAGAIQIVREHPHTLRLDADGKPIKRKRRKPPPSRPSYYH